MTDVNVAAQEAVPRSDPGHDYWNALVDEKVAAEFLRVTPRCMQAMRQRGDGPRFIRMSSRCIRYTRALLKSYADDRVRESTSDDGQATA